VTEFDLPFPYRDRKQPLTEVDSYALAEEEFTRLKAKWDRLDVAYRVPPSQVGTVRDPAICVDARPPTAAEKKTLERARTKAARQAMPVQIVSFKA
jgi:hypothetical protein